MSYATRRTGNQQQNSVGGIGQRRPVVTNNFVPGGTVNSGQGPVKQVPGNQQQRQPGAQNNTAIHFRNQQQQQQPQAKPEPPQNRPPQQVPHQQTPQQQAPQQQAPQQQAPQQQAPQQQAPQQQAPQQQAPHQQAPNQNQVPRQVPTPTPAQLRPPHPQTAQQIEQKVFPQQPHQPQQLQQPDQQPPVKTEGTQPSQQPENGSGEQMEISGTEQPPEQQQQQYPPKRRPWFRRNLPRREIIRRRNFNLSKILKPKNAIAIVNEIIKDLNYEVENISNRADGRTFRASVTYDNLVHEGFGFTEDQAKNGVAEVVLKHYIKSNKMGETKKEEAPEKMEVSPDDENAHVPLPWQHVASFAIYKLFSQWEEDPNLVGISASYLSVKQETKSSRKMPPSPETINPIMLLNQMMPQARFEEIGRSGNPPQVIFSFRCNVDGQSFVGSGTSKKMAKRSAAFEACYKLLGVTYPPEIFVPADSPSN